MLGNGARPTKIKLCSLSQLPAGEAKDQALAALSAFKEAHVHSVTSLSLDPSVFTPAVAEAAGAACPRLTSLSICPPYESIEGDSTSRVEVASLPHLLHGPCAATLRKLCLPFHGGAAPSLLDPLQRCPALHSLALLLYNSRPDTLQAAAASAGSLTQLRSLELNADLGTDDHDGAPSPAATCVQALSTLTRLTRLEITEVPASRIQGMDVGRAVRGLRRLQDLSATACVSAQCLTELTCLKHLSVEQVFLPLTASPAPAAALSGVGGGGHGSAVRRGALVALPPELASLTLGATQSMLHLGRLAAPPSLHYVRLQADDRFGLNHDQINITAEDIAPLEAEGDGDDVMEDDVGAWYCLRPEFPAAMRRVVGMMAGKTVTHELVIYFDRGPDDHRRPLAGPHDSGFGHGPWLSALGPLGVQQLTLSGLVLSAGDLATLAIHLPSLQSLHLPDCACPHAALPVLGRLPCMAALQLSARDWPPDRAEDVCIALAALLVACSPRLAALHLYDMHGLLWQRLRPALRRAVLPYGVDTRWIVSADLAE